MNKFICFLLFIVSITVLKSQEHFPVNGIHNPKHTYYVFTNANIFIDYKTFLPNSTLIIKDGKVVYVGKKENIPNGSYVYDLKGKYIYPAFIDLNTNYGMPEMKKNNKKPDGPHIERSRKGPFSWNDAIRPETESCSFFTPNEKEAKKYLEKGFALAQTFIHDGIMRGTAAFVNFNTKNANKSVLIKNVSTQFSFDKGSSLMDYPSSLMGAIALIRQSFYDAFWYKQTNPKLTDISLEAINKNFNLPAFFEVPDKLSAIRASKIGKEFKINFIILGNGDEYQSYKSIKKLTNKFVLPLNFPKAFNISDPYDADMISFKEMKHWELAPSNPYFLYKLGIDFAFTSKNLEKDDFWKNLKKVREAGLKTSIILKALTYNPAKFLGIENKYGSLEKGKSADFIITSDSLFANDFELLETWVAGVKHKINDYNVNDIRAKYNLFVNNDKFILNINGTISKLKAEITISDSIKVKCSIVLKNKLISLKFENKKDSGFYRLSGYFFNNFNSMKGNGIDPKGRWIDWSAEKISNYEPEKNKNNKGLKINIHKFSEIPQPFNAYGFYEEVNKKNYIIRNATVWTNTKKGNLANTDILISDGKIIAVDKKINLNKYNINNAVEIDANGKHITPGIIDEHSHIAISGGVNEGSQASSAEVRIGDVINPEDINIYRQLAGGVVAAQLLHGSANPIGGQSALIKLRWGKDADEMKIKNADGFIKFALGENVKQSNWGDKFNIRYPQTRMGVEQIYYDYFSRAKEYKIKWNKYNSLTETVAPRKDLELDALAEILDKKRFITCHSYVQSEINMLMHVADSMGFKINTFTHILEGYKIADKMKEHGVGASTFSDWWAYKFEVYEAIPYNAAILWREGIVTAINSDDAEMGRRLNQEAAKTMKYGNVPDTAALKMITLNPAKLLHLDNRMGTIEKGKDADLVIWSSYPLSLQAKAEKTFVDGILYYDIERNEKLKDKINKEKNRIIQLMLKANEKESEKQNDKNEKNEYYRCKP